jgi:peptidoglycan/xylan/chitin deacetylase (PgdA/CDA1 family)
MTAIRHWLRWLWAGLLLASGALWFAKHRLKKQRAIIVLTLHRVLEDADFQQTNSLTGILMHRRTFERLAAYAARRFDIVDIRESHPGQESRRPRCAFTFDDGWSDNYSAALPAARACGMPLTIFLCPGLAGQSMPFWPERIVAAMKAARPAVREPEIEAFIDRLKTCSAEMRAKLTAELEGARGVPSCPDGPDRTLSWTQVLEMDKAGVRFGAHTQTHQVLTAVPEETARREILESRDALERALNKPCKLFAYPNGNHSGSTRRLLAEAGFSRAFTTERGPWTAGADPLAIPRNNLAESDVTSPTGRFSAALFQYAAFWKTWRAMRAGGNSN